MIAAAEVLQVLTLSLPTHALGHGHCWSSFGSSPRHSVYALMRHGSCGNWAPLRSLLRVLLELGLAKSVRWKRRNYRIRLCFTQQQPREKIWSRLVNLRAPLARA